MSNATTTTGDWINPSVGSWIVLAMSAVDREHTIEGQVAYPLVLGIRVHNGPLTAEVQRQIVNSLRGEARRNGYGPDLAEITAWPLPKEPTVHGHQRWLPTGYDAVLWARQKRSSRKAAS